MCLKSSIQHFSKHLHIILDSLIWSVWNQLCTNWKKNSIPKTQLLTMHNVHIIKFDFSLRWTDPLHIWTWRFEFAISHLNFPLKFLRAWRATKTLECSFQKYNTVISWNFFGVWYIVLQIFKTYAPWMKGAYYYLVIYELVWNFFMLFMKKLAQYSKKFT